MGRLFLMMIVAIAIWAVMLFVINQITALTKSRHKKMTKEEKREKFEEEISKLKNK